MSKKSKKTKKKLNKYKVLYHETSSFLSQVIDELRRNEKEMYFLKEFISYKKLLDEFEIFRDNAHEEYDEDNPFPYLTID